MSKITKKRLYAILAVFACILSCLMLVIAVSASVVDDTWLHHSVQGYSKLGFVVFSRYGDSKCVVDFPLTPSAIADQAYSDTAWDSQFYYSNFSLSYDDGSVENIESRIEYLQNSDGDIPSPSTNIYSAIWGDFDVAIDTRIVSWRQFNKAMMGNISSRKWRDVEEGLPDGFWSILHYELGDVYYWYEDTLDDVSDNQSIRQVLRIPFSSLGTEELDMGTEEYDYSDLVYIEGLAGRLLDVGTGESYYNRDALSVGIRTDEINREILVYVDVEFPDDDGLAGHLFKLVDCTAQIGVYRGQHNEIDDFNVYVETGYNTIVNIDEVTRSLQGESKIEMPDYVDIGSWLAKGVSGFFDAQIAPGISLGGVLAVFVAFGVTMYLIKLFLGG